MEQPFDRSTWKARVRAWWQEAARDLPGTARRLGVRSAYGLLTASAWLPLLQVYAEQPGPAVTALVGLVSGVGSNLVANLVQGTYDQATAPGQAEREVREDEGLRAEHRQLVEALEAQAAAREALGEAWDAFLADLRQEDRVLGGGLRIESGGGPATLKITCGPKQETNTLFRELLLGLVAVTGLVCISAMTLALDRSHSS